MKWIGMDPSPYPTWRDINIVMESSFKFQFGCMFPNAPSIICCWCRMDSLALRVTSIFLSSSMHRLTLNLTLNMDSDFWSFVVLYLYLLPIPFLLLILPLLIFCIVPWFGWVVLVKVHSIREYICSMRLFFWFFFAIMCTVCFTTHSVSVFKKPNPLNPFPFGSLPPFSSTVFELFFVLFWIHKNHNICFEYNFHEFSILSPMRFFSDSLRTLCYGNSEFFPFYYLLIWSFEYSPCICWKQLLFTVRERIQIGGGSTSPPPPSFSLFFDSTTRDVCCVVVDPAPAPCVLLNYHSIWRFYEFEPILPPLFCDYLSICGVVIRIGDPVCE